MCFNIMPRVTLLPIGHMCVDIVLVVLDLVFGFALPCKFCGSYLGYLVNFGVCLAQFLIHCGVFHFKIMACKGSKKCPASDTRRKSIRGRVDRSASSSGPRSNSALPSTLAH